jgi:hypothetical protein
MWNFDARSALAHDNGMISRPSALAVIFCAHHSASPSSLYINAGPDITLSLIEDLIEPNVGKDALGAIEHRRAYTSTHSLPSIRSSYTRYATDRGQLTTVAGCHPKVPYFRAGCTVPVA